MKTFIELVDIRRIDELLDHAKELHKGQIDKTGVPYWHHCTRVLQFCETLCYVLGDESLSAQEIAITALFHDVIEDVEDGEEKLKNFLSPDELTTAMPRLRLLTKPDDTPYDEYVAKVVNFGDKITLLVKFADMIDHIERLPLIEDEKTRKRLQEKYREPYKLLRQKFVEMAGAITMPYPVQAKSKNKRKMKFWSGK